MRRMPGGKEGTQKGEGMRRGEEGDGLAEQWGGLGE